MTTFPVEFFLGAVRFIFDLPITDIQKLILLPTIGLVMLLQVVVFVLYMRRLTERSGTWANTHQSQ
jgi:hypothetical protein